MQHKTLSPGNENEVNDRHSTSVCWICWGTAGFLYSYSILTFTTTTYIPYIRSVNEDMCFYTKLCAFQIT